MPEFTQSWAFTFIVGVVCFVLGFALAIIIAGSGRGSRMEERISDEAIHEATKREEARQARQGVKIVIATRGKSEDA